MSAAANQTRARAAEFSVVVAANDDAVLGGSLLRSPDLRSVREVLVQRGCASAALAYNAGLKAASGDLVVFVHQDVFLPEGWFESVERAIAAISARDPDWGVLGVFGVTMDGAGAGHLYSTGLRRVVGQAFDGPIEVQSLDEVVLIVRRSSGLAFDEGLPGFHLYGTDICLEARRRHLKCYALDAFCIHNTNGIAVLPAAYREAFFYMRRKWRAELPVETPCMAITRWGVPLIRHYVSNGIRRVFKRHKTGKRCADPSTLYRELSKQNWTSVPQTACMK